MINKLSTFYSITFWFEIENNSLHELQQMRKEMAKKKEENKLLKMGITDLREEITDCTIL